MSGPVARVDGENVYLEFQGHKPFGWLSVPEALRLKESLSNALPETAPHLTPEEAKTAQVIASWIKGHGLWAEGLARGVAEGKWRQSGHENPSGVGEAGDPVGQAFVMCPACGAIGGGPRAVVAEHTPGCEYDRLKRGDKA